MEAFAIKGPNGIEADSIRDTEAECWCDWVSTTWMDRDDSAMNGYRCVPVQVTEIEPKEPK